MRIFQVAIRISYLKFQWKVVVVVVRRGPKRGVKVHRDIQVASDIPANCGIITTTLQLR